MIYILYLKEKRNKKLSPETSLLMSTYKNEITHCKNLKDDKKMQQMIKLLQTIKLFNTMSIIKNDKNSFEIIQHSHSLIQLFIIQI